MRQQIIQIEISFEQPVEVPDQLFQRIVHTVDKICKHYEATHPGRIMWASGIGSKITYMPMTPEEEYTGRHMEFADDVLEILCCEREDYGAICSKCGMTQGDHKGRIVDPPAGDCDFALSQ